MTLNVVVQRANSASLLLDNAQSWQSMGLGLVVYVSFAGDWDMASSGATSRLQKELANVASRLVAVPLLTQGVWGDGSGLLSIKELLHQGDLQCYSFSRLLSSFGVLSFVSATPIPSVWSPSFRCR